MLKRRNDETSKVDISNQVGQFQSGQQNFGQSDSDGDGRRRRGKKETEKSWKLHHTLRTKCRQKIQPFSQNFGLKDDLSKSTKNNMVHVRL